jgi:hypothetical protein
MSKKLTLAEIIEKYDNEEGEIKEFIEKKLDSDDTYNNFLLNKYNTYKWLFFIENHDIDDVIDYFKKYFSKYSLENSPTLIKFIYETITLDDLKNIIMKELNKIICKNTLVIKRVFMYPADEYISINYYDFIMEKIKNEKNRKTIENILKDIIISLQSDIRFKNLFI